MKTILRPVVGLQWLSGLMVFTGGLWCCTAASPLAPFGYDRLNPPASRPTLLILANFTNRVFTFAGQTCLGTNNAAAVTTAADAWMFDDAAPEGIQGYMSEMSYGRFAFDRAGAVMVFLPASQSLTNYQAINGDLGDWLWRSNIVRAGLMQWGSSNLMRYDANGDGVVHDYELELSLVANNEFGGGTRGQGTNRPAGWPVAWAGSLIIQDTWAGLGTMGHELLHLMNATDLYGLWGGWWVQPGKPNVWISQERLNEGLSIMSGAYSGLDAWHKVQFGWAEPAIVFMRTGGLFTLRGATLGPTNALLLYDPSRGAKEFFLLEYRSSQLGQYESGLGTNHGLALWHVLHDSANSYKWYGPTVRTNVQSDWLQCTHCQALYRTVGVTMSTNACPSSDALAGIHEPFASGNDTNGVMTNNLVWPGQTDWRQCTKCLTLFYGPNQASSACHVSGRHTAATANYTIVTNNSEWVGSISWRRCINCQSLFFGSTASLSTCSEGGHHIADSAVAYTLPAMFGQRTIMHESPSQRPGADTNFWTAGNTLWGSDTLTPRLRWYDGSQTSVSIRVRPFTVGSQAITIEILSESDTWVDFAYGGTETGTFSQPYNTFAEGTANVGYGGTVNIKTGVSSERLRVTKAMSVQASGGPVTIGRP